MVSIPNKLPRRARSRLPANSVGSNPVQPTENRLIKNIAANLQHNEFAFLFGNTRINNNTLKSIKNEFAHRAVVVKMPLPIVALAYSHLHGKEGKAC